MEPLEVVKQIRSCLVARPIAAMVHSLPLEHAEEAFAGGVVGAMADNLTGADRLLCGSSQVTRCYALGNCETGPPWEWNMPSFIQIDLKKMTMSTPASSVEQRRSPIAKLERNEGQILLQGTENGRAFSMSIAEKTGLTSMAIALDGMTISAFGACTPLE